MIRRNTCLGLIAVLPLIAACSSRSSEDATNSRGQALNGAAANWALEGPTNLDNGQVENLPNGNTAIGAIHAVVAHPTNANILYIGAVNGGIWRTNNATAASPTWQPLTDFEGSLSVSALVMDPTNDNVLLAGFGGVSSLNRTRGDLIGLLLTTDGGATWTTIDHPSLVGQDISALYAEGTLMLAATRTGAGVQRSTDGGANWVRATGLPLFSSVSDLYVDPSNRNRVYAAVLRQGVYLSTDGGQTFTDVSVNDPAGLQATIQSGGATNAEIVVGSDGRVFLVVMINGQAGYIGFSDNQGGSWTRMDIPRYAQGVAQTVTGASNTNPIVITTAAPHGFPVNLGTIRVRITGVTGNTAANGDFVVAPVQAADPPNQFTLVASAGNGAYTGGGNWQQWADLNPRRKPGGQGGIHLSLAIDPGNSNNVFLGGDRQDFPNMIGATNYTGNLVRGDLTIAPTNGIPSPQWEHLTHSNAIAAIPGGGTASGSAPHADSRDMTFDANGDIIEVDDGGIYRRTSPLDNTGDWFALNGNLAITEFHNIAYDPVSGVIIGGSQDNGNPQQDTGSSGAWTEFAQGDGGDVQVDSITNAGQSIRYTSAFDLGGFTRSVFTAGNTLVSSTRINPTPPPGVTATPRFVTPFELNVVNPQRIVIAYAEALFESFNQGSNIVSLGAAGNADGMAYGHPTNAELLWAAAPAGVFVRTTAGGALAATNFLAGSGVDVVADPNNAATAYAITATRVFVTTDTGANWTEITGDLTRLDTGANLRQITFVGSATVNRIVVAADSGVFVMAENARGFWNELGPATLPNALVFDLDYEAAPLDLLIAGTFGRGAWSLANASTIDLPPAAICRDRTVDADAVCLGHAVATDFDGGSFDPEGQALSFSVVPPGPYTLGATDLTLNVSDAGATEQCTARVTVRDVTKPEFDPVASRSLTVCNPDEETITLEVPQARDNCDPDPEETGRVIASTNPTLTLPLPLSGGTAAIGVGTHTIEWTAVDDSGNTNTVTQTITIGPGIYVSSRFDLRDRARILTADGSGAAVANTGTLGTQAGVESFVGELLSRSRVELRDRSTVDGNLLTTSTLLRGTGVTINGVIRQNLPTLPVPAAPALPSGPLPTTPGTSINVEPGGSISLAPGAYTAVVIKSRSVLRMRAGTYVFNRLQLEPESRVEVDLSGGPVLIVVRDQAISRPIFQLSGGSALDFTWWYQGTSEWQFEFPWQGRLFAPNARVVLSSDGTQTYAGQLFVKELEVRPSTRFVCQGEGS